LGNVRREVRRINSAQPAHADDRQPAGADLALDRAHGAGQVLGDLAQGERRGG